MKKNIKLNYGELYCGPGGLSLGAIKAILVNNSKKYTIEHKWATDYDTDSCKTYSLNICPKNLDSVLCTDIRNLNIDSLAPIDIFAYGFPCNDFSVVGEQNGINGKFGPLYSYGVRVINRFDPLFFVAENVSGIKSADAGKTFKMILKDLSTAGIGYNLTIHLYKAEQYGVPQTRHRVIIVGVRSDLGIKFNVPKPTHIEKYISVEEALGNPPIPDTASNNELTKQSPRVVKRLEHIKPGQNAWNAKLPESLRLNVSKTRLSHIYKKLHPNKPAYTITGSGGGGTHVYHWKENRALTNRERARIQTFPDNFIFYGSKESVRKQIGMAVPPVLSQIIFESILKTYAGISYEHLPSGNLDHLQMNELFNS